MRHSRNTPEVHAGSMADIAFLLLIFFLITTTIPNDKGIVRGLPDPCPPEHYPCDVEVNQRNVFEISVNKAGALLVNNTVLEIELLKEELIRFIDNNGDDSCKYCSGERRTTASDNPKKAAISLATHRSAPYHKFIAVQDEITAAYTELRTRYAKEMFLKKVSELTSEEMKQVKEAYPFLLSDRDSN